MMYLFIGCDPNTFYFTNTYNFCILSYLELFRETLNRFQMKQASPLISERYVNMTYFTSNVIRTPSFT